MEASIDERVIEELSIEWRWLQVADLGTTIFSPSNIANPHIIAIIR